MFRFWGLAKCQGASHPQDCLGSLCHPCRSPCLFSVPVLQQGVPSSRQVTQCPILCHTVPRAFCEASQGLLGQASPSGRLLRRSCHLPWALLQAAEGRAPFCRRTAPHLPSLTTKLGSLPLTTCFPKPSVCAQSPLWSPKDQVCGTPKVRTMPVFLPLPCPIPPLRGQA